MPDIVKEIFAKNLRYLMESKGITQADICRALDVSSATVSDWCSGKKYPRTDKIQHLADMLGVLFSTLTTENGISDYEDMQRLEALHQNPTLCLLFDKQKKLDEPDLNAVLAVVNAISKERDHNV
jgi:transcriptional regulator with XRE-family HTH domain